MPPDKIPEKRNNDTSNASEILNAASEKLAKLADADVYRDPHFAKDLIEMQSHGDRCPIDSSMDRYELSSDVLGSPNDKEARTIANRDTLKKLPFKVPMFKLGVECGSGIASYFYVLMYIGTLFSTATLCAMPWVIGNQMASYYYNGIAIANSYYVRLFNTASPRFEGLSLGSILDMSTLTNVENAHMILHFPFRTAKITREVYTIFIQSTDVLASLIVIAGTLYFFKMMLPKKAEKIEERTIDITDYTVKITGFPQNTKPEELARFLADRFGQVTELRMCRGSYWHLSRLKDAVLERARATIRKQKTKRIDKRIEKLQTAAADATNPDNTDYVAAFATFEHNESVRSCLRNLKASTIWGWLTYKQKNIFKAQYRLSASIASPPTAIIYENLGCVGLERILRKGAVGTIIIGLLIGSFAAICEIRYKLRLLQAQVMFDTPQVQQSLGITTSGALNFAGSLTTQNYQIINNYCQPIMATCSPNVHFGYMASAVDVQTMSSCYSQSGCPTTSCYACYCEGLYRAYNTPGASPAQQQPPLDIKQIKTQCGPYFKSNLYYKLASAALIVVTVFVNIVLRQVILWLIDFERSHSHTERERSKLIWIFIAQYVNTAILNMLANAKVRGGATNSTLASVNGQLARYFSGSFSDFTQSWYIDVGNPLLYSIFFQAIALPIVERISDRIYAAMIRAYSRWTSVIQYDVLKAYERPEFDISQKLAEIMFLVSVAMTYGTGLPALYPIVAFAAFFVFYPLDKHQLLRVCKIPPRYNERIVQPIYAFMLACVGVHLAIGGWMLGYYWTPGIDKYISVSKYTSQTSRPVYSKLYSRPFQVDVFAMYLLLVIMFLGFFVKNVLGSVIGKVFGILCCCCYSGKSSPATIYRMPSFSDAFRRHILKGATSYS